SDTKKVRVEAKNLHKQKQDPSLALRMTNAASLQRSISDCGNLRFSVEYPQTNLSPRLKHSAHLFECHSNENQYQDDKK
ncbi:MAG: hypothetical protein KBB13_04510, partial [Anaerolineaceae bacterium]|nr:hypothetical protein [Anaerolineaceae bacterium]